MLFVYSDDERNRDNSKWTQKIEERERKKAHNNLASKTKKQEQVSSLLVSLVRLICVRFVFYFHLHSAFDVGPINYFTVLFCWCSCLSTLLTTYNINSSVRFYVRRIYLYWYLYLCAYAHHIGLSSTWINDCGRITFTFILFLCLFYASNDFLLLICLDFFRQNHLKKSIFHLCSSTPNNAQRTMTLSQWFFFVIFFRPKIASVVLKAIEFSHQKLSIYQKHAIFTISCHICKVI